ncbi:MotA/TolQ/ExbB proton channel family protein [Variovorax sp. AFSI2.2]|uniref:MotA/TolQ/ExbB proton channel family protein n=1 Tax=Variovorax sp. AFSI2.2 TaxID=3384160 RepID=UPI003EBE0ADC
MSYRANKIARAVSVGLLCIALQAAPPAFAQAAAATPPSVATAPERVQSGMAAASEVKSSDRKNVDPIENPYGVQALWRGSDLVARTVLLLLALMSAGSWYIMVAKFIELARMHGYAGSMNRKFWNASSVQEGAAALEKNSPYRYVAQAGAEAVANHSGLKRHIPLPDWIPMNVQGAVDRVHANAHGGLAFLATVGSTSPFVGLFGTVWGIYHALTAIGLSGQASIDKVAGPVGEALIMTAIGLAVAIPAVLGYNLLAKRSKAVMDQVREFSEELNAVVVGSTVPSMRAGPDAALGRMAAA